MNNKKLPYKIQDREGNIFIFAYYENGFPVYRTNGGCKHIFEDELQYYTIVDQNN